MEVQTNALPQNDSSSDIPVAPSSLAEGGVSHGPLHVFPVLAASLAFLRKIEMALETPVFERLVGEVANDIYLIVRVLTPVQVLQEACAFISSSQIAISARSGKIHGLLFACRSLLQLREATQVH